MACVLSAAVCALVGVATLTAAHAQTPPSQTPSRQQTAPPPAPQAPREAAQASLRQALAKADYYKFVNEDLSLSYANQAYTKAVVEKDRGAQAEALTYIIMAHKTKGEYDKALELSHTLTELAQSLNNNHLYAQSLYQVGSIYLKMGVLDAAYANFTSSIDIFRNYPTPSNHLAAAYNGLAVLYAKQTLYDKTRDFVAEGLKVVDTSDKREYLLLNNNLALCHLFSNEDEKGEKLLQSLIDLIEKENIPYDQSRIQLNLCRIYIEMNRLDKALGYGQAALASSLERQNALSQAQALYYIGYVHRLRGAQDSAMRYFLAVENLTTDLELQMSVCVDLASIYSQKGNYKAAYGYAIRQARLSDSLNLRTNRDNLNRLTHEYQYKQQLITLNAERNRHRLMWLSGIVLTLLVLIILWTLYSRQRFKLHNAKLQQKNTALELEQRNKEIVSKTMYLQQKNQSIATVAEKLSSLRHHFKNEQRAMVDGLIRELSLSAKDTSWEEFEMRFEQVHVDFFKSLNQKFPGLSQGEKRLCAYLKLNMDTKEIAKITRTSPGSVEQARYRLRKKLNLSRDTDLQSFIESI